MANLFEPTILKGIASTAIGAVASYVVLGVVWAISRRLGFVDRANPNTGNRGGAALGGGVGLIIVILALAGYINPLDESYIRIAIAVAGTCLIGLIDDLLRLEPWLKLLGQLVCALFYTTGLATDWMWVAAATAFLLLGSNAWNVVDVMDSLLGTIAGLCMLGVGAMLWIHGELGLATVALVTSGASGAYLLWNRPPAKLIMGDAGSIALGMLYAIIVVDGSLRDLSLGGALLVPGMIPFFEVGLLLIERTRAKIPFYRTTPHHFALRMKHNGWSIGAIVGRVAIAGSGLSALGILVVAARFPSLLIVLASVIIVTGAFWAYRFCLRWPVVGESR